MTCAPFVARHSGAGDGGADADANADAVAAGGSVGTIAEGVTLADGVAGAASEGPFDCTRASGETLSHAGISKKTTANVILTMDRLYTTSTLRSQLHACWARGS